MRIAFGTLLLLGMGGWHQEAGAQGTVRFDQKYTETIQKSSSIEPLGTDSFGDSIDLASGSVQFRWTDIDIPGNSSLPVRLQRALPVEDRMSTGSSDLIGFGVFGILDVPYLKGVHTPAGWQVAGTNPNARCSAYGTPPQGTPYISASDYWSGNWMHIPWAGDQLMLHSPAPVLPKPDGGTTIMTKDFWAFKCLPETENGYPGEGFIAISPGGEKYHFDHVVVKSYTGLSKRYGNYAHTTSRMDRKMVYFLVSRIEDRFGNWVTYKYNGEKLEKILASDGRFIQIDSWNGDKVGTVSSSVGTWTYSYPSDNSIVVALPDGSHWRATSTGALEVQPTPSLPLYEGDAGGPVPRCPAPEGSTGGYTIAITLPSGATATYDFAVQRHFQSNVPKLCNTFIDEGLMSYRYLTIPNFNDSLTLVSKTIVGPGLPAMQWTYNYYGGGGLAFEEVCADPPTEFACPATKSTVVLGPENSYERRTFGNMYKRNAGQLLMVEEGYQTPQGRVVQRTTLNTYVADGDLEGQPFPKIVGSPGSARMDEVMQAGLRPLRRRDIVQDEAVFTRQVTSFDVFGRPIEIVKSSAVATLGSTPGGVNLPPADVPSILVPSSSNTGSYAVGWNSVSGADTYELRERGEGGVWSAFPETSGLSRPISGKGNGNWSYAVRACASAGCTSWSASASISVALAPAFPPDLVVPSSSSSGSYSITWSAVSGATSYQLRERLNSDAWQTPVSATSPTSITGRSSGTWGYSAAACNDNGCSDWSIPEAVVVTLSPASPPDLVVPAASSTGDFSITWNAVSGATSYKLRERLNGGAWRTPTSVTSPTSIADKASGTWGYSAAACNVGGCSDWSLPVTVVVTLPPSLPPDLVVPAASSTGDFSITWNAVSGATSYKLRERLNGGAWKTPTSATSPTPITDRASGTWGYSAAACNVGGCSDWSLPETVVVTLPPASPPDLVVPAASSTGDFPITWTPVSGATSYKLRERLNDGAWKAPTSATSPTSITGKTSGAWGYSAAACNVGGCSDWSLPETVVVTLPPASPPDVVVPATNATGNYLLTWSAVSGATYYKLREQLNGGSWTTTDPAVPKMLTGRVSGTWGYSAAACNVGGCSGWSLPADIVVVTLPPASAPILTAPDASYTGAFSVSWTAVATANRYELREQSNAGSWTTIQNGTARSRSISGKGSATWGYSARACFNTSCSAWSTPAKAVAVTLPPTGDEPALTAPATSSTGSYTVSWTAVPGATRYELDKAENSGAWAKFQDAASRSKAVSGQKSGNYLYRVRACNVAGCAAYSSSKNVAVTLPMATATISASVPMQPDLPYSVSWTAVPNAARYELEQTRTRVAVQTISIVYTGSDRQYVLPAAMPGTTYSYRVRACDLMSCGAYSASKGFTVPSTGPGPGGPGVPDGVTPESGEDQ
ncbi:hypothetical protein [Luteimonas notoginsengisoli]